MIVWYNVNSSKLNMSFLTQKKESTAMSKKARVALNNYEYCFELGLYTAARSWWNEFVALGGLA